MPSSTIQTPYDGDSDGLRRLAASVFGTARESRVVANTIQAADYRAGNPHSDEPHPFAAALEARRPIERNRVRTIKLHRAGLRRVEEIRRRVLAVAMQEIEG